MKRLLVGGATGRGVGVGLLAKYHTNTAIRIKPTTPPITPPAMAPVLEAAGDGVSVIIGGGVDVVMTGGGGGEVGVGTGGVMIFSVKVGALVTLAVPELELLNWASLELRLAELMFAIAVNAWFLLSTVTVVSTLTTLPLDKSRLKTAGMEAL